MTPADLLRVMTLTLWLMLLGCQAEQKTPLAERNAVYEEFDKAADRPPTGRTLYAMGRLLASRGQDEKARFVFQRALALEPKLAPAYNDLAEVLLRLEQTEEAVNVLHKGLEIAPENPVLLNNLGMCHLLSGEYVQARDCFERALNRAPDDRRFQANRALALGLMGDYDEAVRQYTAVVGPQQAHHNVAVICKARGDTDAAAQQLRDAQVAAPRR